MDENSASQQAQRNERHAVLMEIPEQNFISQYHFGNEASSQFEGQLDYSAQTNMVSPRHAEFTHQPPVTMPISDSLNMSIDFVPGYEDY